MYVPSQEKKEGKEGKEKATRKNAVSRTSVCVLLTIQPHMISDGIIDSESLDHFWIFYICAYTYTDHLSYLVVFNILYIASICLL